jgi:hypothetical protein
MKCSEIRDRMNADRILLYDTMRIEYPKETLVKVVLGSGTYRGRVTGWDVYKNRIGIAHIITSKVSWRDFRNVEVINE